MSDLFIGLFVRFIGQYKRGVIMSNFGIRLKELRTQRKLGQKEIGAIINVSDSSIRKYESGERTPTPDAIKRLAAFFEVTTDYLLGNDTTLKNNQNPPLNTKDNKEITSMLEEMKCKLQNEEGLMFDGNPATPESVQSILDAMQIGMEMAKKRNKEKYTPKKYKK